MLYSMRWLNLLVSPPSQCLGSTLIKKRETQEPQSDILLLDSGSDMGPLPSVLLDSIGHIALPNCRVVRKCALLWPRKASSSMPWASSGNVCQRPRHDFTMFPVCISYSFIDLPSVSYKATLCSALVGGDILIVCPFELFLIVWNFHLINLHGRWVWHQLWHLMICGGRNIVLPRLLPWFWLRLRPHFFLSFGFHEKD